MAPGSLLTLPIEIILQILGQFCLHCQGEHTKSWDTPLQPRRRSQQRSAKSWYSLDRHALFSLSLVCRQLRDIAQPVLYHEFILGYGNSCFSHHYRFQGRLTSFMRTLASRPDLAELVQTAYISPYLLHTFGTDEAQTVLLESAHSLGIDLREAWESRRRDCARDYMPWFDVFFENFLSPEDAPEMFKSKLGLNPLMNPWSESNKGGRSRLASEVTAMLLAQLPNLQQFGIQGEDEWFYGRIFAQALEALNVSNMPLKRADIGIRDMSWVQLATGLEELNVHSYVPKHAFTALPYLKILRVSKGVFSEPELKDLLSACTGSLYSFAYEADKPWDTDIHGLPNDHFQPSDIVKHLHGHHGTLRSLHLDLFAQGYHIRGMSLEPSLNEFDALQHLFLTSTAIYDESLVEPGVAPDSESLIRLLPSSIVSFSINGASGHVRLEEGLFGLAHLKQHDSTRFPNLKRVRVNFQPPSRVLSSIFETSGVDFGFDVYSLSQAMPYLNAPVPRRPSISLLDLPVENLGNTA